MELIASTWCSKSAAIVIMAALFIGERPARGSPSRSASDGLRHSAEKEARLSSEVLRLGEPRAAEFVTAAVDIGRRTLDFEVTLWH